MKLPRHAEIWLVPYLKDRLRKSIRPTKPKRAWVAITDHYEPLGMGASIQTALGRVARWRDKWPRIADEAPRDAAGQRPRGIGLGMPGIGQTDAPVEPLGCAR